MAGRLALLLCGLAAVSTGIALVLQDRALSQDLRLAAGDRLASSAAAADRLLADHVASVAARYAAISRTPELRANLATGHAPTLSFYASQLLRDQGATLLGFTRRDGELLTAAGDPRLIDAAVKGAGGADASPEGDEVCVAARDPARVRRAGGWGACGYPEGGAEASLFASRGELYARVRVPLRRGGELEGGLLAVEAIGPGALERFSELSGAELRPVDAGEGAGAVDGPLDVLVRALPGFELRATTTYDAERATIRRARANLVASGVLALFIALAASLLLARAFARPIVRIREATARLSEGDLASRVSVSGGDELGQLGQAFNELASRLTDSQERVRRAQRLARFGSWYYDFESRSFEGTGEFRRLFALDRNGRVPLIEVLDRIRPPERDAFRIALVQSERHSAPFRLDVRVGMGGARGSERVLQIRGHARNRTASRIEGSVQDVTEQRAAEAQIRYLSRHDPLTGLGNREQLMEELRRRAEERDGGAPFALLMIGIDDLQTITDAFGHGLSDQLLVEVADRLVAGAGPVSGDPARGTELVARLGDERFAAILEGAGDGGSASSAAEPVLRAVRSPYRTPGDEVTLRVSAGAALWPADGDDPETLVRNAETALARVQRDGPGSTRLYDESMHADASRRLRIASRLRRAIAADELELHYQPRVEPKSGALLGFEGLARWNDPELGPVPPGEFIPIAEATGSIRALGDWCIETAARQLRAWREAGHETLCLSINLSREQLRPELVDRLLACTEGLDPAHFELEVTESALIEEGDAAIETLTALRAHGFRIALDDFGTGYSSLSYLRGLPLDTVKVDRAFIRDIAEDEDAAALTGSVLAMCRALGMHAVVEGVETREQLEVLIELGYPEVQGFLFSRPLPAAEAEAYIGEAPTAVDPEPA